MVPSIRFCISVFEADALFEGSMGDLILTSGFRKMHLDVLISVLIGMAVDI